jgi:predicted peroxiredoxin
MADKVAFLVTTPPADTPRISAMLGFALLKTLEEVKRRLGA